tara:strand:- start:476 stop:589 length:114 start_codon:yes stop_codon:yes gene_type:complete
MTLRSEEELTPMNVKISRPDAATRNAIGRWTVAGWIG